ncbi:hypothetical protein TNCV_4341402 [Trichonephila clavipes]|nr:hypothetical protein TNCV_4341402 [Trichonephila clavipes]
MTYRVQRWNHTGMQGHKCSSSELRCMEAEKQQHMNGPEGIFCKAVLIFETTTRSLLTGLTSALYLIPCVLKKIPGMSRILPVNESMSEN